MKYIAGGWDSYRKMCVPAGASDVQVRECRQAFYSGAAVLFQTIMVILDPAPRRLTGTCSVCRMCQKK